MIVAALGYLALAALVVCAVFRVYGVRHPATSYYAQIVGFAAAAPARPAAVSFTESPAFRVRLGLAVGKGLAVDAPARVVARVEAVSARPAAANRHARRREAALARGAR